MKLAHITDVHLDYVDKTNRYSFYKTLKRYDGIICTGDTSNGLDLILHLSELLEEVNKPLYLINGNHDFYYSSFENVKNKLKLLKQRNNNFYYLTNENIIKLNGTTSLIGDDGWCDGKWRFPLTSLVFSWDWKNIWDFRDCSNKNEKYQLMFDLCLLSAQRISKKLELALHQSQTVYLATHFPPWCEGWNKKRMSLSDLFWAPYEGSKFIAKTIEDIMKREPYKKLIVLSGHCHYKRYETISNNIELRVGNAEVGKPSIEQIIEI